MKIALDISTNIEFTIKPHLVPLPLDAALMDGCIESGKDVYEGGGKYTQFYNAFPVGMVNAANSLYAVKKLIYDDKVVSMKEMKEALAADFEGEHARIRKLAEDTPKYGNDIDEVDFMMRDHFRMIMDSVMTNKNPMGGPLYPGFLGITAHYYRHQDNVFGACYDSIIKSLVSG